MKCKGHTTVWDQWPLGGKARRAGASGVSESHEGRRPVLTLPVADHLAGPGAGRATLREGTFGNDLDPLSRSRPLFCS